MLWKTLAPIWFGLIWMSSGYSWAYDCQKSCRYFWSSFNASFLVSVILRSHSLGFSRTSNTGDTGEDSSLRFARP